VHLPTAGRLLLCRHGQTEFNAGARFQGQTNTPLSERGRAQARLLASRLAGEHIDVAYASDLDRAKETALIALDGRTESVCHSERSEESVPPGRMLHYVQHDKGRFPTGPLDDQAVPLHLDQRLREVAFGRWEGLTFAEIRDRFPEDVAGRERDRVHFAMPGGESLAQLAVRAEDFLVDVLPRHQDQSTLVVAHGGTINVLLSNVLDIPLSSWWRLRNHNANVSLIHFSPDGPRLMHFNDTCHLAALAELRWP